jgi:hypothetical protein
MIYISVPNEVWCAGGIAVLEKHISRNARWYRFLRQWHFWLITFVVSSAPIIADKVFHRETLNDTVPLVLWAVSYVILLCPSGTPA